MGVILQVGRDSSAGFFWSDFPSVQEVNVQKQTWVHFLSVRKRKTSYKLGRPECRDVDDPFFLFHMNPLKYKATTHFK